MNFKRSYLIVLKSIVPFLIIQLILLNSVKAQLVSGDVFLKGKYVEVGIAPNGCYGSRFDCPAGYHGRSLVTGGFEATATSIGFVADPDKDGWTVGAPAYRGDYFLPAGPVQTWGLRVGTNQYFVDRYTRKATGFPTGLVGANVSTSTIGAQQHGIWQGSVSNIDIQFDTYLDTNKLYFVQKVKLKNTSAVTQYDIYYLQSLDPDNDVDVASNFSTKDTIVYQSPEKTLVIARGASSDSYLGLGAKDCRSKVFNCLGFIMGSTTFSFADIFNETASTNLKYAGGFPAADNNIGIVFKIDSLLAGDSTTLSYAYILKQEDLDSAFLQVKSNWLVDGVQHNSNDTINVCAGSADLKVVINNGDAYGWSWSPSTGLASTSGKTNTITVGTTPVTYRAIGASLSSACGSIYDTLYLTINPNSPTSTGKLSSCIGSTSTLTGSAVADATTPWASSNTAVATVSSAGVVTGMSAGTAIITYKNNQGCTKTATFTVNALPAITGTLNACIGKTSTLTGSATADATTPWTSSNTGVATISSTGVVTGVAAGTSTITYKNSNGCEITASFTVNALPTITGTLVACVGKTVTLTGSATPNATTPWTSSNTGVATISGTGVVTAVAAGTSTITYKNTNGCEITATFTVNALPTISGTLSACIGKTATLTGSATPDATTPWTSSSTGVAIISSAGVVTTVSVGTTTITYKNSNGCEISATFTVNALPSISGTLVACVGKTSALSGTGTPDATTPWTSSNTGVATVSSTGVVTGVAAGTSTITYKNNNGCEKTASFTVNATPVISGTLNACIGKTAALTGSATADATTPWTSSNTAVATISSTGLVTTVSVGTTTITYKNTNACDVSATFTVNPLPSISGNLSACIGKTSTLSGTATADATTPWTSSNTGVATVSSAGVVTGVSAGTTTITYKNSNGCIITATFTVNPLPVAPTVVSPINLCIGVTALPLTATGTDLKWYTTASGGTSTPSLVPSTTSLGSTDYYVSQTTLLGCEGPRATITATVQPSPTLTITPVGVPDFVFCDGKVVTLKATAPTAVSYDWQTAGMSIPGAVADTLDVGTPGYFGLTVKNVYGCLRKDSVLVKTNPLPYPTISPTDIQICEGVTIMLYAKPASVGYSYDWFKDGTSMGLPAATSNTAVNIKGNYSITVTDIYKCVRNTNTTLVSIYPTIIKPKIIRLDPTLKLDKTYVNYQWYRNGKAIAGAIAPTYYMKFDGTYFAEVSDAAGCFNYSDTVAVNALGIQNTQGNNMNISIYPNPTQNIINIDAPIAINIVVTDIVGKLVISKNNVRSIDLSDYADGTYFFRIMDQKNNIIAVEKINKHTNQ